MFKQTLRSKVILWISLIGITSLILVGLAIYSIPRFVRWSVAEVQSQVLQRTGYWLSIDDYTYTSYEGLVLLGVGIHPDHGDKSPIASVEYVQLELQFPDILFFRRSSSRFFSRMVLRGAQLDSRAFLDPVIDSGFDEPHDPEGQTDDLEQTPNVLPESTEDIKQIKPNLETLFDLEQRILGMNDKRMIPVHATFEGRIDRWNFLGGWDLFDDVQGFLELESIDEQAFGTLRFSTEKQKEYFQEISINFGGIRPSLGEEYVPQLTKLPWEGQVFGSLRMWRYSRIHMNVDGRLNIGRSILDWPVLAPGPVELPEISYDFSFALQTTAPLPPPGIIVSPDPPGIGPRGSLITQRGLVSIGGVNAEILPRVWGLFPGENDLPLPTRLGIQLSLEPTDIMDIVQIFPPELRIGFGDMDLGGTFAWDLELEIPMDRIGHMNWRSDPRVENLEIRTWPRAMDVFQLENQFWYHIPRAINPRDSEILAESDEILPELELPEVEPPEEILSVELQPMLHILPHEPVDIEWLAELSEHSPRRLEMKRENAATSRILPREYRGSSGTFVLPFEENGESFDKNIQDFTLLQDMSPWLIKAVLTGEDGDFFFHPGIDWNTFRSAIVRNLESREVQFGASTLSMQLVKNLFLDHNRELVRKFQEVFLVYIMEHVAKIPKERILELYLNIAETGPGISGVAGAARFYFDKDVGDLDPLESVWIASMLPSPARYSAFRDENGPAIFWLPRMQYFLDIMVIRGRIDEELHATLNPADLRFALP